MPTPEQHALLSASSSERWLKCPPSVRLGEGTPETTSEYAEAGRVAHAIAEIKARSYFLEPVGKRQLNALLKPLKADPHYDKGIEAATDMYLDYLKELAMSYGTAQPAVALEVRVNYSDYAPEGFGTSDCVMVGGDMLAVIDYKNGAGVPVSAEHNSQMMLYALGALKLYAPIYGDTIKRIHMAIVQPNAGGVKEWETTREYVEAWGIQEVRPIAELAYNGVGNFAAGDWCRFCPVKAQCTARATTLLGLEADKNKTPTGDLMTDAQLGDVLSRALTLESWVKDLKDYALTAALAGREISGFKVVEGRGSRDWAGGADKAFPALMAKGIDEALLYERKPVTPPALEKALGKATFKEAADDLVEKKPGKPALVPAEDPRKPYNAAQAAFGGGGGVTADG